MQVGGEFFVGKQRVNLLVAGRADVNGGAKILAMALVFAFGVLLRGEVMGSELGAGAIAQLTGRFALK